MATTVPPSHAAKSETPRGRNRRGALSVQCRVQECSDGLGSLGMHIRMDEEVQRSLIETLRPVISVGRLGTYLVAAGFDPSRALQLYIWNARVGEAFHLPIQAVEVGLRNRINDALLAEFGGDWWKDERLLALLDAERQGDIALVLRRIRNRGLAEETGQVVAGLSFGFWVGMLQGQYNRDIWSRHLRSAFPDFPDSRNRKSLAAAAGRVAYIRNRISHHEPVIKLDLAKENATLMELLGWICPHKLEWIRPHCRVSSLLAEKP